MYNLSCSIGYTPEEQVRKLPYLATLLISVSIIVFLFILLYNNIVCYEDFYQIFYTNGDSYQKIYTQADHGCLVSWVFMKMIGSFIPLKFNVHPNDNLFGNIVIGINFAIYIFLASRFAMLFCKNKKFMPVWYLISFACFYPLFFYQLSGSVFTYCRHYRYVFAVIFYLLFWNVYIKSFVKQKIPVEKLGFLGFLSFFVGVSVEPANISAMASLIFLVPFQLMLMAKENNLKFSEVIEQIKLRGKKIYIPFIFFFLGCLTFYLNPEFWNIAKDREVLFNIHNYDKLVFFLSEFIKECCQSLFLSDGYYLFLMALILLSCLVLALNKNIFEKVRVVVSAWGLFLGVILFYLLLIIPGKTYYDGVHFWVVSADLRSFVFCVFLCSVFILAGYLVNYLIETTGKEKLILILLSIVAITAIAINIYLFKLNFNYFIKLKKSQREMMYKFEKMYVFYSFKGADTAVLPQSLAENECFGHIILKIGAFKKQESWFLTPYFTTIYKRVNYIPIKLLPDKEAMKLFYSRGGKLSADEIETADFTKLLDENFILNDKN